MINRNLLIIFVFCILPLCSSARADQIIQPMVLGTSFDTNAPSYPLDHVADQKGFIRFGLPDSYISGVTDFSTFTSNDPAIGSRHSTNTTITTTEVWRSTDGQSFSGHIDFDLGSRLNLSKAAIWNARDGANEIEFYTSPDNTFSTLTFIGAGTLQDPDGPGGFSSFSFADVINLTSSSPVQFVRLSILSTYDVQDGAVSIGEVAFSVPEPGAGIVLTSICVAAFARRKRK